MQLIKWMNIYLKILKNYRYNLNSVRHILEDDFQKIVKGKKHLVADVLIAKD